MDEFKVKLWEQDIYNQKRILRLNRHSNLALILTRNMYYELLAAQKHAQVYRDENPIKMLAYLFGMELIIQPDCIELTKPLVIAI